MTNKNAVPARILGIATAVPPHKLVQTEVARVTADLFGTSVEDFKRLVPVYSNAAIETRYSCVPIDWYTRSHGLKERNALFIENAVDLLEQAADRALVDAGLERSDIDCVVSVSTSGIATPSLDALIVERMQLKRTVERLPIFGLGCLGGVIGLVRAGQLAASRPGSNVLLLVVELCGLTFRHQDHSKSNIIATALFGDGAGAAIIRAENSSTPAQAPALSAWGEHTWPNTLDVMGWKVEEDGLGVLFAQSIPGIVRKKYRSALDHFLMTNDIPLESIEHFALHPGGARVVDALEVGLGLAPDSLIESRKILKNYGNMSAATVLFVLKRILKKPDPSGRILLSSLGPGFTAGFLTLDQ
jgi:alkylresorcinol/alkylpyrone synthase